jgi:RNA-binding protein 26
VDCEETREYVGSSNASMPVYIIDSLSFHSSDADADVLADYVLALLRHDGDTETVRQLCEAEIPDFLKEDSTIFVRDVFDAIRYKSYLLGAVPPRRLSVPFAPPSGPSAPSYGNLGVGAPMGPQNGSRKRSYQERGDGDHQDRGFQPAGDPSGRMYKQPRRGGPGLGRGMESFNPNQSRGGGAGRASPMNLQSIPPQGFPGMPGMPSPPPGMPPFDPNNPMGALLAMQAMGLPFPGLAPFPTSTSPIGRGAPGAPTPPKRTRCKDYDTKGFCAKGNTCPYEHGEHSIWVPPVGKADEYDPTNSNLMAGIESNGNPVAGGFNQFRGSDRDQGRGKNHRGDGRAFNNPNRRGGRAEFSSDRPNFDKNNTTIVVEQIPEDKFSEDEVRGFFSEFGNILEISMRPYKRLAIVKFEQWDSAQAAYKSPKVIFDNRFVKVYWFTNADSLPQPAAVSTTNGAAKNGFSTPGTPAPARATSEPKIDIEEFTRRQEEVQKAHEEKQKKLKEVEATRKELEKRQENLLKSQAEEKRKLVAKLAAKRGQSGSPPAGSENAASAEPENPTDKLKKQLAALEAEAQSLGIDYSLSDDASSWGGRGRGRGRGGYRGRGAFVPRGFRGGYRGRGGPPFAASGRSFNLDNRPKTIGLTGIDFSDSEKDESLRQYLLVGLLTPYSKNEKVTHRKQGVGEYTGIEVIPGGRTSITFKDRHTAEKFMYGIPNGEIPAVGKVELSWIQTPLPPVTLPAKASNAKHGDDDIQMDDGDAMAVTSSPAPVGVAEQQEAQENLDYDVADDNEWGIQ